MATWIIFQAADQSFSGEPQEMHRDRVDAFGSHTNILTQHWDYSCGPLPSAGYRPSISKRVESQTNGWPDTYSAPGDWVVTDVMVYDGPPGALYEMIAVCDCVYSPIPDGQRPWKYVPVGRVSADNFGDGPGAEMAFQQWKADNPDKWRGTSRPESSAGLNQ